MKKIKISDQVGFQKGETKTLLVNMENRKNLFISNEILNYILEAEKNNLTTEEFINEFCLEEDRLYISKVIDKMEDMRMWEYSSFRLCSDIVNFSVDITNDCNLRCKHCCVSAGEKLQGEDLSTQKIKEMFEKICSYNPRSITISGGEPLVRKDFVEIIQFIKSCYSGQLDLMTNAILVDKQMAEFIANNFTNISVSLDGVDEKTCSIIRGEDAFGKTMEGIYNLKSVGINNIEASMVVCEENEKYIKDFVKLCREKLGIKPKLRELEPGGRIDKNTDKLHYIVEETRPTKEQKQQGINTFVEKNLCKMQPETYACQAARREFAIDFRGYIYPCASLIEEELCMGNIFDIHDINCYFDQQLYKDSEGYKVFESYVPYNLPKCRDCNKNLMCNVCVRTIIDKCRKNNLYDLCDYNNAIYDMYFNN